MKNLSDDKKGSVTLSIPKTAELKPEISATTIKNTPTKKKSEESSFLRRILRPTVLEVNTLLVEKGFCVNLSYGSQKKHFDLIFPDEVWKAFPHSYKLVLRDNLAYLSSLELGLMLKAKKIKYDTPLPLFKSFFVEVLLKCLLYSGDCDTGKTIEYIARLCNLESSFKGTSPSLEPWTVQTKENSINTFTFGKESLLSWGLAQEIGLNPLPVLVVEPDSNMVYRNERYRTFENKHKKKLIVEFEKEFDVKVHKVQNGLGEIRDYMIWDLDQTDLGWSNQLTEYLFMLLPFNYFFGSKYIIYGNEYSSDAYYYSSEGFKCHPVYDQSSDWMSHMNTILQNLSGGAVMSTSLVQPLQEIAVTKVLYQRYPHLAKYQMSCHADNENAEKSRWCNACSKCATCFLFMKALGFDNNIVGLKDMLSSEYKNYFALFHQQKDVRGYYSSALARDEQLFAFHLAAKRGVTGELIELFKKEFGEEAANREEELRNEFFKVHRPENLPSSLWKKLKPIFEEELKKPEGSIEAKVVENNKIEEKEEAVKEEIKKKEDKVEKKEEIKSNGSSEKK